MAGKEPVRLRGGETRFTIAFEGDGNPLDRVLRAAPLLEHIEQRMSTIAPMPTRMDLRLYKSQTQAVADLIKGEVDFMQMNASEYMDAQRRAPGIQLLVVPSHRPTVPRGNSAILFTREESEAAAPVSTAELERLRRDARRPEPPVPRHKAAPLREV